MPDLRFVGFSSKSMISDDLISDIDTYNEKNKSLNKETKDLLKKKIEYTRELYNRTQVLVDLFLQPGHVAALEAEHKEIGKFIERKISIRTAIFFLSILVLTLGCIAVSNDSIGKFLFGIGTKEFLFGVVGFIISLLVASKYYYRRKIDQRIDRHYSNELALEKGVFNYFISQIKKECRSGQDFRFRAWLFLTLINPFSLRQLWWWTLVIGFYRALEKYIGQSNVKFDPLAFTEFTNSFLAALLTSIIAYIATNVIRELLQLREKYVEGIEGIKNTTGDISRDIENHNKKIEETTISIVDSAKIIAEAANPIKESSLKINEGYVNINRALLSIGGIEPIITFTSKIIEYVRMLQSDKYVAKFISTSEYFVKSLGNYASNLTSTLFPTNHSPSINIESRLALTSSFASLLKSKIETLNKKKSILTSWTNLGTITAELLETFFSQDESDIEFYALQLKSPQEYLHYLWDGINDQKKLEWEKYILTNIKYAREGKNVYRYFVVMDNDNILKANKFYNGTQKKVPIEISSLESSTIMKEIKKEYFSSVPLESLQNHLKDNSINDSIKSSEPEGNCNSIRLYEILEQVIHKKGHCFIRNYDDDDYINLLIDYNIFDNANSSNKPFDYLAFRRKTIENKHFINDWLFCLESRYDCDLDIADIKMFYEEASSEDYNKKIEWKSCAKCTHKEKLMSIECSVNCKSGNKFTNRMLVLNKIFFGNEWVVSLPREKNGREVVQLANGSEIKVVSNITTGVKNGEIKDDIFYWDKTKIKTISEYALQG